MGYNLFTEAKVWGIIDKLALVNGGSINQDLNDAYIRVHIIF